MGWGVFRMIKKELIKSEAQVTKECVAIFRKKKIIHFRNNVLHGKFKGFKDKAWRIVKTGLKGISDWGFFLNDGSGRTVYLELKATGEDQSQDQKDFQADCDKRNIPYYAIDDPIDLMEILDIYGM